MSSSRPAAVAGLFYPSNARDLVTEIASFMADANAATGEKLPKALIVPHAGYVYSGAVAASAYALLQPLRKTIRRVVLLGPTHRVAVRGLAISAADSFATPLGEVRLDHAAIDAALQLPQVVVSDAAHAQEHSLEVQLPFLQSVFEDFALVPFAVGDASPSEVAEVLELLWGGEETLIVISSDLSHYQPYGAARTLDSATVSTILHLDSVASHEQACGATPINGLLLAARQHQLTPKLLDLRNSGDTAGDKSRVVGYAAIAFA